MALCPKLRMLYSLFDFAHDYDWLKDFFSQPQPAVIPKPSDLDPRELGSNEVHSLILCAGAVTHQETKPKIKRNPIQKTV